MRLAAQAGRNMSTTEPRAAPSSSASGVRGQTWLLLMYSVDSASTTAPAMAVRRCGRPRTPSHSARTTAPAIETKMAV
jgi:hypothetical protein